MYDTDTMQNETIRWFVIMMAPHLLIGFVSLPSLLQRKDTVSMNPGPTQTGTLGAAVGT